jgi:hypothetical protein
MRIRKRNEKAVQKYSYRLKNCFQDGKIAPDKNARSQIK